MKSSSHGSDAHGIASPHSLDRGDHNAPSNGVKSNAPEQKGSGCRGAPLRLALNASINDLTFTPDGRRLVIIANSSPALLLDASSLTVLVRFGISTVTLESLAIAPTKQWIGTVYKDGTVRLWDLDGQMRAGWQSLMHRTTPARPHSLAFAPDGRLATVTGNHGFFWIADLSGLD